MVRANDQKKKIQPKTSTIPILNDLFSLSSFSEVFCREDKTQVLKENETITFTKLAETYEKIAEGGPDVFYKGQLAEDLVRDIQAAG